MRGIRPPFEAFSLPLRVTVGCSHNGCSYCDLYREEEFRVRSGTEVGEELGKARSYGAIFTRVFLCEGDALSLPTSTLLRILRDIREYLPWVKAVATYGDTRGLADKSQDDLRQLREWGLTTVYHGLESGHDPILMAINKGGTRDQAIGMADRLRQAGIFHSVIVMLGLGGVRLSEAHARDTASALTEMDPPRVAAVNTRIPQHAKAGLFELPDGRGLLNELRILLAEGRFTGCSFFSSCGRALLPPSLQLPRDRDRALAVLDRALSTGASIEGGS